MSATITYRGGYKYQLVGGYAVDVETIPDQNVDSEYIALTTAGRLTIRRGYAWDGPSGPSIHSKNFMRGSLVHDALYQLMRQEHLDKGVWREQADLELKRICREDGMWPIRASWVYWAVRKWGDPSASPESRKKTQTAP